MAEILQAGQTPQRGVTYDMRASLAQLPKGASLNMATGFVGGSKQSFQPQVNTGYNQRAADSANAGNSTASTGYLYGVGSQKGPGVTPTQQIPGMVNGGFGPNPGTLDPNAMNKAYNTGAGTMPNLGNMLGGNPGTQYAANYTGYGNSSIGGPQNNTPTSMPPMPAPTSPGVTQGQYKPTFIPAAQLSGNNAIQTMINQTPNRNNVAIAPPLITTPKPTSGVSNTNVGIPTQVQPAPPMITIPPAGYRAVNTYYHNKL